MAEASFTLVQLRYFAAAAELGSMTAAAQQLMVSQSAVSTAVAHLEKDLRVQLLLRHHARGLTLTDAGRSFYQELRSYLVHTNELVESARSAGGELVGDLTIGCFNTIAPFRLPGLLASFHADHPEVNVSVLEGEHAELVAALRAGRCEIALMYGYDIDTDMDAVVVDSISPYVLLPAAHRLARRRKRSVALKELSDLPFVLLDLPSSGTYLTKLLTGAGLEPDVRHRSTGYETVRAMVAHGHGYTILNQRPAHDLTYDGHAVVALDISDDLPPLEIVLCSMSGARLTRRARAFARACRDSYAASPSVAEDAG